ncbi:MAG: DUF4012 domain-containing protein [Candidatus Pacebacteria bacterium]|nr:DUF4012 domain-containing protein [Candidatus Paceibacterota bacterium]
MPKKLQGEPKTSLSLAKLLKLAQSISKTQSNQVSPTPLDLENPLSTQSSLNQAQLAAQQSAISFKKSSEAGSYITPSKLLIKNQNQQGQTSPASSSVKKPTTRLNTKSTVDKTLLNIFSQKRTQAKVARTLSLAQETKKIIQKSKRRKLAFFLGLGLMTTGLLSLLLFGVFTLTKIRAQQILISKVEQVLETSLEDSKVAESNPVVGFLATQVSWYSNIIDGGLFDLPLLLVSLNKRFDELAALKQQTLRQTTGLFLSVMSGQAESNVLLNQLNSSTQKLYQGLALVKAEVGKLNPEDFSESDQDRLVEYQEKLSQSVKILAQARQLEPVLPEILGVTQKKTYAVLLQNNQELRPTGGFIQAVALLTFDKGMLIDVQVFSVYELDQKLPGAVTPPEEIKRFLGEQKWFLRDSNWNPDFPATARKVTWFIEQALNKRVDGVMAVNLVFLEDWLTDIGSLNLPEYNEILTAKNLRERMEFHAETNPNQAGQQDYSALLLTKFFRQLENSSQTQAAQFLATLYRNLESHQVLLSLNNANNNQTLMNLGWAGNLITPQCPAQFAQADCVVDFFNQVESNVGVNKINSYISRDIVHNITLNQQEILHQRKIVFENQARSKTWPLGDYRNYLRFYLPQEAKVESVRVAAKPLKPDQLVKYSAQDRQVVGLLVEIPPQESVTVELTYVVKTTPSPPFSYVFFDQQQSGVVDYDLAINLYYNQAFQAQVIAPQAQTFGQRIIFEPDSQDHAFVGVMFE